MTVPGPRRLTHANLFVADMERSMDFYMSVIGLDESYRRVNLRAGFLTNGNSHHDIAVMEYGRVYAGKRERAAKIGLNHLAFEMENDLELNRWYGAAVAAGARIHRTVDHGNTHSCYMHDPDGIQIEVYCDTVKEWWHLKTGAMTTPLDDWTPGEGEHSTEPMYLEDPVIGRMEDALLHPVKTTHAVLVAADFEACFDFYTGIVGLSVHSGGRDGELLRARRRARRALPGAVPRGCGPRPRFPSRRALGLERGRSDGVPRGARRCRYPGRGRDRSSFPLRALRDRPGRVPRPALCRPAGRSRDRLGG